MTEIQSSTGGRIIATKTGLIHYGNTERYSDDSTRTVGRPECDADHVTFDFSAFEKIIKLTAPTGRIVTFK